MPEPAGAGGLVLDSSCTVLDNGATLVGGSPLRIFRLGSAGTRVVAAIRDGTPLPRGHEPLTRRLVDAGAAHPVPRPGSGPSADDVTLVIPAFGGSARHLDTLVRATGARSAIVVDDASPDPIGPVEGTEVVRLPTNSGPGPARAAGLERVTTPFVAFLDTDTDVADGWMEPLLGHFADERVGAVAPRLRSLAGAGVLARYEWWRSPLDLGGSAARVRAGTRVSYVPTAALVCRVAALREVGGFDPALRTGEDVDLVWRLDEAGHDVRYEPTSVVGHAPRPDWRSWARQRRRYGSSAAPLARRHPGALAPARVNRWSAIAWGVAVWSPAVGTVIAGATTVLLARKLSAVEHPGRLAARLGGLGHLYAGRILASAVGRAWLPLVLVPALVSRRARRAVVVALVVPPLIDWISDRPEIDPVRAVGLRIADDAAYCAGVWQGMIAERSLDAIRPTLTVDDGAPDDGAVRTSGRGAR